MNNKTILLLFVYLIFNFNPILAQDLQKLDKLIKKSNSEMYENPEKVISIGFSVLRQAKNNVDLKIKSYKLISDGYSSQRDYQKSLSYLIKALQLLPKSDDKLLNISINTKAGIQYHQLNIYQSAITYLDRAEKMSLEYPSRDSVSTFLGINYVVRGFIYKEELNCDIAISFFDKGIKELMSKNRINDNLTRISIAKYNKGNCYLLMEQIQLAQQSFKESLLYARMANAKSLEAFAKKGIAQIYTLNGAYLQAIEELNQSYNIAKNVDDLVLNQEIYRGLSENYLAIKDIEKYKEYQQKLIQIQSKLKESECSSVENLLHENSQNLEKKAKNEFSNFWIQLFIYCIIFSAFITIMLIKRSNKNITELEVKINQINSNFFNSDSRF
jgi:tetratricopeptide (TPR) repeat protein